MKTKQKQREKAYEAYIAIIDSALKAYKADPSWTAYNAIASSATEAYDAKCDEIDASEVVEK